MEKTDFELLLLKTVFACMACDQAIDAKEVTHIQQRAKERSLFGALDLSAELKRLQAEMNVQGYGFFRHYFAEVATASLDKSQQLQLLEAAIDMIEANEEVEYAEVKFIKLIRSELSITDEEILARNPNHSEYLKQDVVSPSYKEKLMSQFFVDDSFPVLLVPDFGGGGNISGEPALDEGA